jgi:CHAD domain-containing protein
MNPYELMTSDEEVLARRVYEESQSTVQRRIAHTLLAYQEGKPTREVSAEAGISPSRARFWRRMYKRIRLRVFRGLLPVDWTRTSQPEALDLENEQPAVDNNGYTQFDSPIPAHGPASPDNPVPVVDAPVQDSEPVHAQETAALELPLAPDPSLASTLFSQTVETVISEDTELPFPQVQDSPGLLPEDSLAEAGRKIFCYHFAEMLSHEEGTRSGEDIEDLHDMRVATRRMRAAFDLFQESFDPKVARPLLKRLKSTGRALGAVRDMDVFVENARKYASSLPEADRDGLAPLIAEWLQERELHRREMIVHLDSRDYQRFKRRFNRFVQTPGLGVNQPDPERPLEQLVRNAVPQIIYQRLGNVRAYETVLENASLDQLHALRIEAKKLRYAVEFFREVLGPEAKDVINTLKKLQDHLGELNDARVACQLLSEFLEKWEMRQATQPLSSRISSQPLVSYLAASYAQRHRLMLSFPEAWEGFMSPSFRQNLARAVGVL